MLQSLFNNFLNRVVKIALWFYFSEIKVRGNWRAYKDSPVVIVANHQNALLDPLLIATYVNLKPHFLTRASVFKNPLIAKILAFIRMVPVFRIRDGFGSIPGNKSSFTYCESVLEKQGKILVFPEGNHSLKRQVRPLSKGFTRIVSGTLLHDPEMDLKILPIGINYQAHQKSGTKVLIDIGKPITANQYIGKEKILVKKVERDLQSLTLHLPEDNYKGILTNFLLSESDITEFRNQTLPSPFPASSPSKKFQPKWRNRLFKFLHLPLYLLWIGIKPNVKDNVFYGTTKFCLGLVGVPVYYLFIFGIICTYSSISLAVLSVFLLLLSLKANRNWHNQGEEDLIRYPKASLP